MVSLALAWRGARAYSAAVIQRLHGLHINMIALPLKMPTSLEPPALQV